MNLLCLNCGGEFTIDTSVVGTDGATIKCDLCGNEQPLFVRRRAVGATESGGFRFSVELLSSADRLVGGAPPPVIPVQPLPPVPRPSQGAGTFKKPMSSSWADKRPGDPAPPASSLPDLPPDPLLDDEGFFVPDLAASIPDLVDESAGGPFVVRSPAALVFEFPDFLVLEEWTRGIEKTEKYLVQDQSGAETQLGDFVRRHKSGPSRSGAIRNVMKAAGMSGSNTNNSFSDQLREMDTMMSAEGREGAAGVNAASQFQFRIEEEKTRSPRKAILAVVLAVAAVGIVVGALFLLGVI